MLTSEKHLNSASTWSVTESQKHCSWYFLDVLTDSDLLPSFIEPSNVSFCGLFILTWVWLAGSWADCTCTYLLMDFGPSKCNFLSWHIGETAFFCIHSVAHYSFINMSTKERKKKYGFSYTVHTIWFRLSQCYTWSVCVSSERLCIIWIM